MTNAKPKVRVKFHVGTGRTGHRELREREPAKNLPVGRIPRISRLMALAIRFDQLIRDGVVKDQADLARLGLVSRARVTQIMDLLTLAPDIQQALLFLPLVHNGRDSITERDVRSILSHPDWRNQHRSLARPIHTVDMADEVRAPVMGKDAKRRIASTSEATKNRPPATRLSELK